MGGRVREAFPEEVSLSWPLKDELFFQTDKGMEGRAFWTGVTALTKAKRCGRL